MNPFHALVDNASQIHDALKACKCGAVKPEHINENMALVFFGVVGRADALDVALRLLRDLPPDTCGECLDGVRGSGEDCCVREDLEQHRWGRKRADLLARFPEEATE